MVTAQSPDSQGIQMRLARLMQERSADRASDWRGQAALELAETLIGAEVAELPLTDNAGSLELNLALYRMSYEASLACEHARQTDALTFDAGTAPDSDRGESVAETLDRRLELAREARGRGSALAGEESVGQLAAVLCLGLIDAYEARDRYDYPAMRDAIRACDEFLPRGCTIETFRVLQAVKFVADAGLSRDGESGSSPDRQSLGELATRIGDDRDGVTGPYADHALLVMVTAIGHMQRKVLVDDFLASERDERSSLADWVLATLAGMEDRGAAAPRDWPIDRQVNPIAHHVHFYRYFAHHVRAIAFARNFEESVGADMTVSSEAAVAQVREEYGHASAALEQALRLVPPTLEQRWRYYDLSAENLEHEEGLRIALLEQQLTTRGTVRELAETSVRRFSEAAKEELRDRMADVSMRIVEIIGVFLAVIAILGATVASATIGELSFTQRILLLSVGGAMPVVYFLLLRFIVMGEWRKRRSAKRSAT